MTEIIKVGKSLDKKRTPEEGFEKAECPFTYAVIRLLRDAYVSGEASFAPKYIRSQVSKHFSYITDGSQHDSHEFFVPFCAGSS